MIIAPHRDHRDRNATIPLAHTDLQIDIHDLLATYELRHAFKNHGETPIEAVYSFPVPLDAAFCGMNATIGFDGRQLSAQVLPARGAEQRYDGAISDGDSAVLLEELEPGLLCVNLGNLLPGESGEIVLTFAAALNVADYSARFSLPLVHRPRYGRSRLDALVTPQHDFAVEHPLSVQIRITGLLADCAVRCNLAGVRHHRTDAGAELMMDNALLDRDLVLAFDLAEVPPARAMLVQDETPAGSNQRHDCLAVVTALAPRDDCSPEPARDICLLLDGSGSMIGDAIVQSRQALHSVADLLGEQDRIQVIPFGTRPHPMFRRPLRASELVRQSLYRLADTVDANLGGTEMAAALESALDTLERLDGPPENRIIILVTDGGVTSEQLESVSRRAQTGGVRIFSVAVGSSAGADVLAPLSQATGATMERAMPAEPIDDAVVRQLRRARHSPLLIDTDWGTPQVWPLPAPRVYPGDALTLIARCDATAPPRELTLTLRSPDGQLATRQTITFALPQPDPALRAWAGQHLYAHASDSDKEAVALRYGLITAQTKAVLVHERADADKAAELPQIVPVPHMQPEGMLLYQHAAPAPVAGEYMDIPCFLRRQAGDVPAVLQHAAPEPPALFTAEQKQAFAAALVELLLADILRPDLYLISSRVPPEHQEALVEWLKQSTSTRLLHRISSKQRFDTVALLKELLDEGVPLPAALDDEAEAALAVHLARKPANPHLRY